MTSVLSEVSGIHWESWSVFPWIRGTTALKRNDTSVAKEIFRDAAMLVKTWKQPKCSSTIKYLNIYTHIVILFSNEKRRKIELYTKKR